MNKRTAIPCILIALFILYTSPTWLSWGNTRLPALDPLHLCLDSKLDTFRKAVDQADAVVHHSSQVLNTKAFLPFVGNGYIGLPIDDASQLFIKFGRTLSLQVPYSPRVKVSVEGLVSREAEVIDFLSGSVYTFQCFQLGTMCVSIATQIYAHRTRVGVLVQDMRIHNPSDEAVTVEFSMRGAHSWKDMSTEARGSVEVYSGSVSSLLTTKRYLVALAHQRVSEPVTVKSGGTVSQTMLVAVEYTEYDEGQGDGASELEVRRKAMVNHVFTTLSNIQQMKTAKLTKEHVQVWNKLWLSGFSISKSKAAGIVNGDHINATIYNVLSQVTAPLHDPTTTQRDRDALEYMVHFPHRCYSGHHVLQNPKMWGDMATTTQLLDVVRTWLITLDKQGCSTVLKAGADGVMQAMVLSFGALRMTDNHLDMNMHPRDLDRDQMLRHVNYGNNTHVNISVEIDNENKAALYVTLDANDRAYYACDAGCVDTPVRLSKTRSKFPVKLTDPLMPILYISVDKEHLEELQHAIHVKEIGEAPAHEHHVIAMHRHGHQYGGLPVLFWASLSFLILVFHMFLFKLIYNEYCGTPHEYERQRSRTRYHL